ncbi:MAG TPA: polysaccharide deacetylase family protein [Polyangiaceae bacterium]|nr:polysaccharide deacetylase family protein [Polyangiaceae bacterium]
MIPLTLTTLMKLRSRLVTSLLVCTAGLSSSAAFAATTSPAHPALRANTAPRAAVEPPSLRVLPWNGHRAALTLTFDDASPSEADEAVPTLDERGVKGTFFVTEKNLFNAAQVELWALAEQEGHELGNHTVDHCHGDELGHGKCLSARAEIERCNHFIEKKLGAPDVYTFAYPYVDQHGGYKQVAETDFLLARAGAGGLVESSQTPDWYSMDARFIEPTRGETLGDWDGWIDQADVQSKWLVLVFHSILPEEWCEGIPKDTLGAIVDHAKASDDLWIDTFVNVGAYLRAERMFEALHPAAYGKGLAWHWALPHHFPHGKSLRVALDRGALRQNGVALEPDATGHYTVALDAHELEWTPRASAAVIAQNTPSAP